MKVMLLLIILAVPSAVYAVELPSYENTDYTYSVNNVYDSSSTQVTGEQETAGAARANNVVREVDPYGQTTLRSSTLNRRMIRRSNTVLNR